jgi:hypothetical protein
VHAWLSPPPPPRPLVPLRVSLFEGRPSIVRGPALRVQVDRTT